MTVSPRHDTRFATVALLASAAGVLMVTFGCTRGNSAPAPPPLLEVEVAPVQQKDVPVYREWIGTLDGLVNADIKAEVSGYLIQQAYTEGSFVKQCQLLFQIDPRPFQAAVDQARGQMAQTEGQLAQSRAQLAQAEAQVAVAEAKVQRLVDANVIGIVIFNLEGAITEANQAFLQMVQYGREDLVTGRVRWADLTPAEWRDRDERAVAELRATGIFHPYEKEYFRQDGSRAPVLLGGALFEKSGNEGVAFALDLTEQRRAERVLRRVEQQARSIVDSALDAVVAMDADGIITDWNKEAEEIFGWTRLEAQGRRMSEAILPVRYR